MSESDPIADSLPPPRDDEPAGLRNDIVDELNDHVDCATQRELLRGMDETDARRSAIQRFGNIPKIARQLWWDAMKERIMTNRISIGLSIVTICLIIIFGGIILPALAHQRQLSEQLITRLASLPQQPVPATSLEWGSLTIELLDQHGKPMADWPIKVQGRMYSSDASISRELRTNESGILSLDPIRTGKGYDIWVEGNNNWQYFAEGLFLEPGEKKAHKIINPSFSGQSEVVLEPMWPESWKEPTEVRYRLRHATHNPSDHEWWTQPSWELVVKDGTVRSLTQDKSGQSMRADGSSPLMLPHGKYQIESVYVRGLGQNLNSNSKFLYQRGQDVNFEVLPGIQNHIVVPLPTDALMITPSIME